MGAGTRVPNELGTPEAAELVEQRGGDLGHVEAVAARHQGEYAGAAQGFDRLTAALQSPRAETGERQAQRGRLPAQRVDQIGRQAQQLAVAQRRHRRAAGLAEQPADLAHQLAGIDLGGDPSRRIRHGEPPADQQIYCVRGIAVLEYGRTGGQRKMHGAGGQGPQGRRLHVREMAAVRQAVEAEAQLVLDLRRFFVQGHAPCSGGAGGFLEGGYVTQSIGTVVFSHGKESGPWGAKITAMAAVARDLRLAALSVDYRGIDDPLARVERLVEFGSRVETPMVLVGSSMGGHVSAAAARRLEARGLFLLAPALYMPGLEAYTPQEVGCPTAIVHGWQDAVVPVDHSIRWAREQRAALHVLDAEHRLENQIPAICRLLRGFLDELA